MISDYWKTLAIQAAIKAGKAIMKLYERDFTVTHKEDNSPLTAADLTAHDIITEVLSTTKIPILSEEGKCIPYHERKDWKQFWMVDPLDGTKEFVKRNGEFTVNIALIVGDRPVFGVIYAPVLETLYVGGVAVKGSFKFYKPIVAIIWKELLTDGTELLQKRNENKKLLRVVTSRSHLNMETQNYINALTTKGKEVIVVPSGSSLKFCLLAEGKADIYPRFAPCMEWDTAAGDAICEGVDIGVLTLSSSTLVYNKSNLYSDNFTAFALGFF